MNLLLDTHVLLWWLDNNPVMSKSAYDAIADSNNLVFVSAVSIWEIRIKEALGKLVIPQNFQTILKKQSFEMLSITDEHAHAVGKLPAIHNDPFDRMLITQAKVEKLTIVSHDALFKKYKVPMIKA